jgi:Tol biopolymer transport system component/tRNA A-37 threonylcarbamoyl transferase component Bud32
MGEVYRARDTRLDRDVAIKVLPELFASDPERLARFEREAKALASLSHPHIAQIHEIAELPGENGNKVAALVMELVEGEELSARIAAASAASQVRRPGLSVAEALPIALQIADALEAAHERGLIHRDLKPANIKVSADGDVKVLDFGLAKAIEGSELAADPLNSPTMSIAGTRAGFILGTAAYMAPEQARGQPVDRRADIWSFGVVLFEMLAGTQAFGGETISDVLASVLKNDLNWTALPADLPPPILRLLHRCLTPDRRSRLRDIGEARIAIADYLAGKSDDAPALIEAPPARPRRGLMAALAAVTVIALALAAAVAMMMSRRDRPIDPPKRYVVVPPDRVTAHVVGRPSVSLARDGWTLAFTGLDNGVSHLFVRGPGEFDARRLPETEGGSNPVFSPDGGTLAFVTPTQLKTIGIQGGTASTLVTLNDPRGVAWADDHTIVYSPESIGGLAEISNKGGAARTLTTIDEKVGERTHRWPHVLPGGQWVLFTVGTTSSPDDYDASRIDAIHRATGERRRVFEGASMVRYAATGHLVFARGGSLYAVRFDPATLTVSGQPSVVLKGIGGDLTTGAAHVTWTDDGTLAYVPGDAQGGMRQLGWAGLKGSRQTIDLPPGLYNDIRISPDGARVAVAQGTSGVADIWVYTFARGTYTRLTFTGVNATPVWSADGRDIFFSAIDQKTLVTTILRTSADGGREAVPVASSKLRLYLKHVSRDARWALVDFVGYAGARGNIGRLELKPGVTVDPVVATRSDEYASAVSPDERFVAYQSDADGRPEVYVSRLGQSSGRWQISNAGGEEPRWAPDGKSIYYRIEGRLMRVPVAAGDPFQAGLPVLLFDGVYNLRSDTGISYQPHPDGTRLLMTRSADVISAGSIRVITGWFDELRKAK